MHSYTPPDNGRFDTEIRTLAPGRGPLALLMILLNLRQELENGSGECCRITPGPVMIDFLKNDLPSPRYTPGDRLADQRVERLGFLTRMTSAAG
jgi:hypothetical protein